MSGIGMVVSHDGTPLPPDLHHHLTRTIPYRGATNHAGTPTTAATHQTHHPDPRPQPHTHLHHTITASARIDNRHDLLPQLRRHLAHPDPSDAELILAAHHTWGPQAPHHLIGDFAYAITDHRTHTLHAARDPMGMRPLYHRHTPQRTAVATEIQQILALPGVERTLHEAMIGASLAGNVAPSDWTFFRGVHALPPGHALEADAVGVRVRRFWAPDLDSPVRVAGEQEEWEAFRALFLQAVRDRLQAPGPHGLLLSGGVDSGSIAAAAGWLWQRREVDAPLRTFSWAFEELAGADERRVSRLTTDAYGLPALPVPADDAWPLADYPDHGPDPDDPFVHPYQPLMDRSLAIAAADGVRQLHSGDRGDPLLGDDIVDAWGPWRAGRWALGLRELTALAHQDGGSWTGAARRHLVRPWLEARGWRRVRAPNPAAYLPPYLRPEFAARVGLVDLIAVRLRDWRPQADARTARAVRLGTFTALLDPAPQERRRARFGLGFVDAWADRRLVEFVLATPPWRVNRAAEDKVLARRALRDLVPAAARDELGKHAPSGLFERGLGDRARASVADLTTDMRLAALGYVDETRLRVDVEAFAAGRGGHAAWWVLALEMWLRAHHDG